MSRIHSALGTAFVILVVVIGTVFAIALRIAQAAHRVYRSFLDQLDWTVQLWTEVWDGIPVVKWWNNLPLGYSELHVPAEASIEEVARIIRRDFRHRLPKDNAERDLRVAILLDQHCMWQRWTRCSDRRPSVPKRKPCRRCEETGRPRRRSLTRGTHISKRRPVK